MTNKTNIIFLQEGKVFFEFRVIVPEHKKSEFVKMVESHGFKFTEVDVFKNRVLKCNHENMVDVTEK